MMNFYALDENRKAADETSDLLWAEIDRRWNGTSISSDLTCVLGKQSHDEVDKDRNIKLKKKKSNLLILIMLMMIQNKDYVVGLKAGRGRSSGPHYETPLLRSWRE